MNADALFSTFKLNCNTAFEEGREIIISYKTVESDVLQCPDTFLWSTDVDKVEFSEPYIFRLKYQDYDKIFEFNLRDYEDAEEPYVTEDGYLVYEFQNKNGTLMLHVELEQ